MSVTVPATFAPGAWVPCKAPRGTMGVFPYLRTPILNLDTVIVYVNVYIDGVARRGWVMPASRTSDGTEAIQVCVETSPGQTFGCAGSPAQGVVGTPWAAFGSLQDTVPLDAPVRIKFPSPGGVGDAVMGALPTPTEVGPAPVNLTWTAPPAVFPPPIPSSQGALRFAPLSCVPTPAALFTGTPYAVYDNSMQRNPLRALPVPGFPTLFDLVVVPPGAIPGTLDVSFTFVWPSCMVPSGRLLIPAVVPSRRPRNPCDVPAPNPFTNSCNTCPVYWTA